MCQSLFYVLCAYLLILSSKQASEGDIKYPQMREVKQKEVKLLV